MDRDELHAQIRRLIFASPALSEAFSRGEFRSVFKGRGVDFEALREYDEGEDARFIDWNVTVRLSKPYVRLYREDRSLTLFLLIDLSPSMEMGSGELSKRDAAVLASSLLAYAAQLRGMPVGALLFDGTRFRFFAPRQGKVHALALIDAAVSSCFVTMASGVAAPGIAAKRGAAAAERGAAERNAAAAERNAAAERGAAATERGAAATERGAGLREALEGASRLLKRRSLVIAASDFRCQGYEDALARLARRHDLVALRIADNLDIELPTMGGFALRDPESGVRRQFPLVSRKLRARWKEAGEAEKESCRAACFRAKSPLLEIDTTADPAKLLLEFFGRRRRG